jgi:O-antigen/teichoic acid export membrane protein
MIADTAENPPVPEAKHHAAFFRQSGWLMVATIGSGLLMWVVHFLNKFLRGGEYGSFVTLLSVIMLLPNIPLQMVLAQQTARALACGRDRELSGIIRLFLGLTGLAWLVGCVGVLAFQGTILARWGMSSPTGIWVTLLAVLAYLWMPIFSGVLQGQQNFLWLGWSLILAGIGRIVVAAVAVVAFHGGAAGMMVGVLLGTLAAVAVAAWQSRAVWLPRPTPFDWRHLLGQVAPLLLAFLAFQALFTSDTLFVKAYFPKADVDCYGGAGTLSRALMWLVLPLATVMFPRLVHSAAKAEKSNLMGFVLLVTAVLASVGALGVSLLGPWIVRIVYKPEFVALTSSILPWYAVAMIPLALSNVLLNDMLARPAAKLPLAYSVLGVTIAYLVAITHFHASLVMVLQIIGLSGLLLLGVCAWFNWGPPAKAVKATAGDGVKSL